MKYIDNFLNGITMYRLLLYYLIFLLVVAFGLSFFEVLSFNPLAIAGNAMFFVAICWITNTIFAKTFGAPTNLESVYITALILSLIVAPIRSYHDLPFLGWVAVWAMASKYIFAFGKKHFFNPAAFGVALAGVGLFQSANWWVGTGSLLPFVLLGGFLIVRKIQREDMVGTFFLSALLTIFFFNLAKGTDVFVLLKKILFDTPIVFFAFVMLTEPLTTPPTKLLRMLYGGIVGILYAPQVHVGSIYSTPELALLVSNMYSYIVSPKQKLVLTLSEKIKTASDMFDFVFPKNKNFSFLPGQYMEWTIAHKNPDSRGTRRYFTLASSPTEDTIRLGVKVYPNASSFKRALVNLSSRDPIVAGQLAGDFTLPSDTAKKLVFVSGGIGVTPYRSIIKYLLDKKEKRAIVHFYSNKNASEIVYKDIFDEAQREMGIKTVYTLTDKEAIPPNWKGRVGRIDAKMIQEEVSDYKDRLFYLSGPHAMVIGFEEVLHSMGVNNIKKDFFPGFV